jgi:hypothetical protein
MCRSATLGRWGCRRREDGKSCQRLNQRQSRIWRVGSPHRLRRARFRREIPSRLEAPTNKEGESTLFCSAITQPVFA